MQLLQSVGSKSLIVRCGVGMFHPSKDEIYVNLTVPARIVPGADDVSRSQKAQFGGKN